MIYAAPGAIFTAVLEDATTGQAGTIGVRIENADGTNHTARVTAGIVELEAGSGIYAKDDLTAPTAAGTYVVLWDSGGGSPTYASEELTVTSSSPSIATGPDLTTLASVRAFLQKGSGDTDQDALISSLITRASAAIQAYAGREFSPVASTARTFIFNSGPQLSLEPYDLRAATSVVVGAETNGPNTTVASTDYSLRPKPSRDGVYRWIRFSGERGYPDCEVTVTGTWGFASIPEDVVHWANVTVALWLRRDVATFESTFSLDEERLERPQALPAAVRAGLGHYRTVGGV